MPTVLKDLTWEKHKAAEKTPFMQKLLKKEVDINGYYEYLLQLRNMYFILERTADERGLFTGMEAIKRCQKLNEDIIELEDKFSCFGGFRLLSSVDQYREHIKSIQDDDEKLMAHIYVRYMGDMSGGQIIKKMVFGSCKFYEFDESPNILRKKLSEKLNENMAEEANIGFDFMIRFLDELEEVIDRPLG